MGRYKYMRGEDDLQALEDFSNQYLILAHLIISVWWLCLVKGLVNYIIRPREVEHVMVMVASFTDLGYNYARFRLKKSLNIISTIIHLVWIFK